MVSRYICFFFFVAIIKIYQNQTNLFIVSYDVKHVLVSQMSKLSELFFYGEKRREKISKTNLSL